MLPRETGFYLDNTEPFISTGLQSQLMNENKVFLRGPHGLPRLAAGEITYHLENEKFVSYLEFKANELGITVLDEPGLVALLNA